MTGRLAHTRLGRQLSRARAELIGFANRRREIHELLGEVADTRWQPTWWLLAHGVALLERSGTNADLEDLRMLYVSAIGGPQIDTFMARRSAGIPSTRAARIARAVVRARSAIEALEALDGQFPRQPLRCAAVWRDGRLRRDLDIDPRRVVFLTGDGGFVARLEVGGELALARALATGELERLDPDSNEHGQPTRAAIAVSLLDAPVSHARHIHRQAWTSAGGPWLGVGDASPYEVVTTCHIAVDGYAHGCVTGELFRRVDALAALESSIANQLTDGETIAWCDPPGAWRWRDVLETGVADDIVPGHISFAESAYAFGKSMARLYPPRRSSARTRFSPTFLIPTAPRASTPDRDRRRRRVIHAPMALHIDDGATESFTAFRDRLRAVLDRELEGNGVVTRVLQVTARLPVPDRLRRYLMAGSPAPRRFMPPFATLAGRGVLSSLRFDRDDLPSDPLYAVSSPPLAPSKFDPRGSAILTLVHHDDFVVATASGTGWASTRAGAARVLATWREELDRVTTARTAG